MDTMSATEQENVEKTEDKKKIEEEEKMLNEENKKHTEEDEKKTAEEKPVEEKANEAAEDGKVSTGEVERKRKALEEATKKDERGRIPTGGIRMPGFLQRRSKDRAKSEPDPEEGVDLLEDPKSAKRGGGEGSGEQGSGESRCHSLRRMLPSTLPALRPHLANMKLTNPFTKKKMDKDVEAGNTETTPIQEEGDQAAPAKQRDEDGMETVQLDVDEKGDPEKAAALEADEEREPRTLIERFLSYKFRTVLVSVALFLLLVALILFISCCGPRHDFARGPVVDGRFVIATASCGPIQGLSEDGASTFRGIPYARPPVGALRWKAAQPMDNLEHCWNGTLKAHAPSNVCWQIFPDDQSMNGSEDCLTLDIYTPQVVFENLLPVVVIVGSSHMTGGSTTPLLQPTAKLSRAKEVVFVRINFRLGVLGFLSTSALTRTAHPQTSGNYGLSDIKLALKWVQKDIAAFGGDPKSVTVLGYRAGATLVTALTATPSAKDLMKRVWVTSGSADFPGRPLSDSENDAAPFLARLQCNDTTAPEKKAQCLRSLEAEDLLDAMPAEWRPVMPDLPAPVGDTTHQWLVMDGDILRSHPFEVWQAWERESPIEFVIGATAHADATLELFRNVSDGDKTAIESHVRDSVLSGMKLTEEALKRYNATWPGLASLVSDLRTVCPLGALASKLPSSAYVYVATFPISVSKSEAELEYQEPLAELGIDIAAIMGRVEGATPEERRYITAMQQLFYQFVRGGELPVGDGSYRGQVLVVDQDTLPKNEYPNCNFWIQSDVVPRYGHRN